MNFKTAHGQLVLRVLVVALSFFLTVGNTLRTINISHSVIESLKVDDEKPAEAKNNTENSFQNAKYCEISQFDAGPGKEDIDHDISGLAPSNLFTNQKNHLHRTYQFLFSQERQVNSPPLFILYCQRKVHLATC